MEEPIHAEDCAKVCEYLRSMKVEAELIDGKKDFRSLIINSCQRKFEQNLKANLEAPDSIFQKRKRRYVGNIRFIGELYNLHMLTDRIMHEIIRTLLDASDKDAMECLYWLLCLSGKNLEESTNMKFASRSNFDPKDRQDIQGLDPFDKYFAKIGEIVKTKEYPSHVKYLLQHVIDLRKNDW